MARTDRTRARLTRGIEHIERATGDDLLLAHVASEAALSEFHFHRLFRLHFGLPVMDYVRRRRLALAAESLLASRAPVLHIALEAGFQSQAAFTRAFRKVYLTTPAAWRTRGRDVPWLSAAAISDGVLATLPGLGSGWPRLETIGSFAVDGLSASLDGPGRSNIPELWQRLARHVGHERFNAAQSVGLSEGDAAVLEGVLGYMAGFIASADEPPAQGLVRRIVPGGAYLVFRFEGAFPQVSAAYDYIFGTWMPGSRHELRGAPSFTRDARVDATRTHAAMDIWIPVQEA